MFRWLGIIEEERNSLIDNSLINKMLAYSAINNIANPAPLNSILNPETNSDSPSTKSNGARLVSASVVINHRMLINGVRIIRG